MLLQRGMKIKKMFQAHLLGVGGAAPVLLREEKKVSRVSRRTVAPSSCWALDLEAWATSARLRNLATKQSRTQLAAVNVLLAKKENHAHFFEEHF